MKTATTIDEQIELLESRGLTVRDYSKAREILGDIGYYRLGFYLFPFEKTYPRIDQRVHEYRQGATFEDAVNLYYFDYDLRLLLLRFLTRVEVHFRTAIIYNLSNKYKNDPTWFVNTAVVDHNYVREFEHKVYTSEFKRNPVISRHHRRYTSDKFAPAWKTIEFMTFGAVMKLYEQLKSVDDKMLIANLFGIRQVVTFESYMHTIRHVRNACAHGQYLYDLKLPQGIRRGPAENSPRDRYNLIGAMCVIKYIISQISTNRAEDLSAQINRLYRLLCSVSPNLRLLIPDFSSI